MTYVPESWQAADVNAAPPSSQKTGMTHIPEAWSTPSPKADPESPASQ